MAVQKPTLEEVSLTYGMDLSFWKAANWVEDKLADTSFGTVWYEVLLTTEGHRQNPLWGVELCAEIKVCAWLYQEFASRHKTK